MIIALRSLMHAQFDWTMQELEEALNCCPQFCAAGDGCEMRLEGPWSVEAVEGCMIVSAEGTISVALVDVPLQRRAKQLKFQLRSQQLCGGNLVLELISFKASETSAPTDVAADMLLARRAKQQQKFLARATQILPPFIEPDGELAVAEHGISVRFSSSPGVRSTASRRRLAPSLAGEDASAGRYSLQPQSVERVRLPKTG